MALVGQGLYKVGKALVDLRGLEQHAKSAPNVKEQPKGDKKRAKLGESSG